jgi:hypothetical protein
MHMRIINVLLKIVFRRIVDFKMEKRAIIKFCVKSKRTGTETFKILNSAKGEERLPRTSVFE